MRRLRPAIAALLVLALFPGCFTATLWTNMPPEKVRGKLLETKAVKVSPEKVLSIVTGTKRRGRGLEVKVLESNGKSRYYTIAISRPKAAPPSMTFSSWGYRPVSIVDDEGWESGVGLRARVLPGDPLTVEVRYDAEDIGNLQIPSRVDRIERYEWLPSEAYHHALLKRIALTPFTVIVDAVFLPFSAVIYFAWIYPLQKWGD